MPWGRSHARANHAAPEPPSSISVSNAWLFVMLCVRCVCVEGAPAPGRRQGAGDGDGCKGDPEGEPRLSSLLQPGWLAGTRAGQRCPWALLLLLCWAVCVTDSQG